MIDASTFTSSLLVPSVGIPIEMLGNAVQRTIEMRQQNSRLASMIIPEYNVEEGLLSDNNYNMLRNLPGCERENENLIPDALALSCNVYCLTDNTAKAYHSQSFYSINNGWVWLNDYFKYPTSFLEISPKMHNFFKDIRDLPYIDKETGLVSGIFFQYINAKIIRIAYVTKGTTPTSLKDWGANFKQGWNGNSALYKKSSDNARYINKKLNDNIGDSGYLYFFGHSLGGGLANYNAMKENRPSITFNAASIHPDSVISNMANYNELVKNKAMIGIYVEGEVLSLNVSDTLGLPKNGNRYKVVISPKYLTNGNMVERHLLEPLCSQYGLHRMSWNNRIFVKI